MTSWRSEREEPAGDKALAYLLRPELPWQMRFGERYALEGLLAQLRPRLSIEIGTAQGGSLARIAAHSEEVHSFDITAGVEEPERLANVEFHLGDSGVTVPAFLTGLEQQGRTVGFVLIDGDHSAEGVERDGRAILDSPACGSTVVVFHDAANEVVREGIVALEMESHPKVAFLALDFVPGYVVERGEYRMQIWNGLALAVLDDGSTSRPAVVDDLMFDAAEINRRFRDGRRGDHLPT